MLSKGIAPDNYWVPTLKIHKDYPIDKSVDSYKEERVFVRNTENLLVSFSLVCRALEINYNSQVPGVITDLFIQLPYQMEAVKIKQAYDSLGLSYDPKVNTSLMYISNFKKCIKGFVME